MSIASQNNKVAYLGNGSATLFPINFAFMTFINKEEHLKVAVTDPNGTLTVLSKSEYRLEQSGGEYSLRYPLDGAGGALANGWRITIVREVPLTQPLDLANGGSFNADVIESSFDYQEMQIQQLAEQLSRTPQVPIDSTKQGAEIYEEFMQGIDAALAAQNFAEASALRAETAANKTEFLSNGFALASSTALANIKAAETHALEDINADGKEQVDLIKAVGDECLAKIIEVCPEAGQGGGGGLNLLLQSSSFLAKAGMGYFLKPTDTLEMTLPEYPLIGDTIYFKGDFGAQVVNFIHGAHPINIPTIGSESLKDIMFAVTYDGTSWTVSRLSGELGLLIMKPSIIAPIQGALNVSPNYTFKSSHFDALDSADTAWKTRWLVKRGKVVVIDTGEIAYSDTFKPALPLEQGVTLTVQKYDIGKLLGATSWSTAVTFTTAIQSIVTPKITNLADGSVDVAIPLHLEVTDFEAVGLPDEFGIKSQLELSKDEFFTQLVYETGEVDYTINFTVPANLTKPLTTYSIRTRQKGDTFGWSPWSDTIRFATKDVALIPPNILIPTEGLEKVTSKPLIVLEAFAVVGGTDTASKTRIQASTSPTFATILQDSGEIDYTTSFTFPDAFPKNTVIYLRAQHKGVLLGDSGYGATRSFKTADFVPSWHKFTGSGITLKIQFIKPQPDGTVIFLGTSTTYKYIMHYNPLTGIIIKSTVLNLADTLKGWDPYSFDIFPDGTILMYGWYFTASSQAGINGSVVILDSTFKVVKSVYSNNLPSSRIAAKKYITDNEIVISGNHGYSGLGFLFKLNKDGTFIKGKQSSNWTRLDLNVRLDGTIAGLGTTSAYIFDPDLNYIKGVNHSVPNGITVDLVESHTDGSFCAGFYDTVSNTTSLYNVNKDVAFSAGIRVPVEYSRYTMQLGLIRRGNGSLSIAAQQPSTSNQLYLDINEDLGSVAKTYKGLSNLYGGAVANTDNNVIYSSSNQGHLIIDSERDFRGTIPCEPTQSFTDTTITTTSLPAPTITTATAPTLTNMTTPTWTPFTLNVTASTLSVTKCELA